MSAASNRANAELADARRKLNKELGKRNGLGARAAQRRLQRIERRRDRLEGEAE
jgi:hypothetical protein